LPEDCIVCGTCCFSYLAPYVVVTGDDYARLGDEAESRVLFDGYQAFMRMESGRCAALRIEGRRFLCSVYETRPDTCRALLRDSAECAGELLTKGDRPLSALRARR
jgi:hypothetical protein